VCTEYDTVSFCSIVIMCVIVAVVKLNTFVSLKVYAHILILYEQTQPPQKDQGTLGRIKKYTKLI